MIAAGQLGFYLGLHGRRLPRIAKLDAQTRKITEVVRIREMKLYLHAPAPHAGAATPPTPVPVLRHGWRILVLSGGGPPSRYPMPRRYPRRLHGLEVSVASVGGRGHDVVCVWSRC